MAPAGASVFIVDDHSFFRAGLRSLLVEHGFPVVGEAGTGQAAIPLIERRRPDVVIMDLSMPGMSGIEATRALTRRFPSIAVLVVTVSATDSDVLDALEAGAAGYLLKDSGPDEIVRALRASLDGDTPLSPRVAGLVVQRARGMAGAGDVSVEAVEELTRRELEVLRFLAQGLENTAIAQE
ncbi:MAG TPA: response regulator transcription factor, partial [Thermoleophilaceae bacterium]|nr:response regulator transcription factor [Thermoleophilaceae bacterium]